MDPRCKEFGFIVPNNYRNGVKLIENELVFLLNRKAAESANAPAPVPTPAVEDEASKKKAPSFTSGIKKNLYII